MTPAFYPLRYPPKDDCSTHGFAYSVAGNERTLPVHGGRVRRATSERETITDSGPGRADSGTSAIHSCFKPRLGILGIAERPQSIDKTDDVELAILPAGKRGL